MAEANIINETNRVTASFSIKVPHPSIQYASLEASIFVPLTLPSDADADATETIGQQALGIAKRTAAEALGIEATTEFSDSGIEKVVLDVEAAFGAGVKVTQPAKPTGGGGGGYKPKPKSGGGGGRGPAKTEIGAVTVLNQIDAEVPEWVEARWMELVDAGKINTEDCEMWDNRKFSPDFGGTGNPKAPWFKTSKEGVALDFGGTWK